MLLDPAVFHVQRHLISFCSEMLLNCGFSSVCSCSLNSTYSCAPVLSLNYLHLDLLSLEFWIYDSRSEFSTGN
jgi:hypothetical protein